MIVYGCVTWPAGEITFANLENCLVQSACINWTGIHAGQVALTLSGANQNSACNDTFYGCVNWTTGKFQVVIPENCCIEYGADCQYCETGKTPKYITLDVRNVLPMGCCCTWEGDKACTDSISVPANGIYILTQSNNPCNWEINEQNGFGEWIFYNEYDYNCTGRIIYGGPANWRYTRVYRTGVDSIDIMIRFSIPVVIATCYGFRYVGNATISNCITVGDLLNQMPACPSASCGGIGGTARVCEGIHPEGCPDL